MDIAKFTNQTASYEPPADTDKFGNRSYAPARTIKVRVVKDQAARRKSRELRIQDDTQYMSKEAVALFGKINGEEIMQVEEIRDKKGVLLGTRFSPSPPNTLGAGG